MALRLKDLTPSTPINVVLPRTYTTPFPFCAKMAVMSTGASAQASPQPQGFRRLWRVLRQLFHEFIGAVFALLALGWFNAAFRSWTRDVSRWLVGVAVAMACLLVFFAVTSFRHARRL